MNLDTKISFTSKQKSLTPIPWADNNRPELKRAAVDVIPKADVLVITYTSAEGQALADVLTPGYESKDWNKYTTNFSSFESELTNRSPAKFSKDLGVWATTEINGKYVVLFKSSLHPSTDATSLPMKRLWIQLIEEVNPSFVITTGTAGGIGANTELGDIAVTNGAKFNCQKDFKNEPYAQETFIGPSVSGLSKSFEEAEKLIEANWERLKPITHRSPVVRSAFDVAGVETVDFFGFADPEDSFGIVKNDPDALTEEMDDAALPLALKEINSNIPWLSIRNASDPQTPQLSTVAEEKKWAEHIYERYGYTTTVGSAITVACCIAAL